ncbi:MAG: hypothetical protein EA358_08090 [Flavobacteriales bacterium]|nr:MAG: hypothetical protein EA358_08090 [Flavobacteriales bacterium]
MDKINNAEELLKKIAELELRNKEQGVILKTELGQLIKKAHPVELIKHGIRELATSDEVQNELVGLSMSLTSGYLTKKVVVGNSSNIFQQVLGNLLSVVVSRNVAINSKSIQSSIQSAISSLLNKTKSNASTDHKSNE